MNIKRLLTDPKLLAEALLDPKKADKIQEELPLPALNVLVKEVKQLLYLSQQRDSIDPDPVTFAARMSKGRYIPGAFNERISQYLVASAAGEEPRLVIGAPPRHGKSFLIARWFPLWYLAKHPDHEVILITATLDLAREHSYWIRDKIITFGEEIGLHLSRDARAVTSWKLASGGSLEAQGVGGSIVGKGAHLIIIDDPIKDFPSELERDRIWSWYQTVLVSRFEKRTSVAVLMTRWHEDDLVGRILQQQYESGQMIWRDLRFPALAEKDDILDRAPGEPLFPQLVTLETLLELKAQQASDYHWAAMYQQRPAPEEGGIVKRDSILWYTRSQLPEEWDQQIISCDLAFKGTKFSDYTVIQVWGRIGTRFYLLEQVREKMEAPQVMEVLRSVAFSYPNAKYKIFEDAASGPAVMQMLTRELTGIVPWPPRGSQRRKQSKEERLRAVAHLFSASNVYIPNPTYKPWSDAYLNELCTFPNAPNDDQVDATSQALDFLDRGATAFVRSKHTEASRVGEPVGEVQDYYHESFKRYHQKHLTAFRKRFERERRGVLLGTARSRVARRNRILYG